jgi:hypothetical protein
MHTLQQFIPVLALGSLLAACGGSSTSPSTSPTGPGPGGATLLTIEDDDPTNASACEARLEFALESMETVVTRANGDCTKDAQCALVFAETQCQGACQAAILDANVEAFEQAQEAINERACTGYQESNCSYATPRCLAVTAVCEDDKCAMRPLTEIAG